MPESYLESLSALPDTVGIALGIDRLTMLFADASDISDVRAFGPDEA
jgi:lysyl-tRNA synthetase class 2